MCASSKKAAHLRRNPRHFPRCALFENRAHLRTRCAPSKKGGRRSAARRAPGVAPLSTLVLSSFTFLHLPRHQEAKENPKISPISRVRLSNRFDRNDRRSRISKNLRHLRNLRITCLLLPSARNPNHHGPQNKKPCPDLRSGHGSAICEIYSFWLYRICSYLA